MLQIYHSNRLERLLDTLVQVLARQPLADPFEPDLVVVQNPGMGRWVAQHLAQRQGVAANLEFPLPASFVWRVFRAWFTDLPETSPFERGRLVWRLMHLLPPLLAQPAFRELDRYLAGDHSGLKRYQLCTRIAEIFDQYLAYRPRMLIGWERGEGEHWQARLWRDLVAASRGAHWAGVLERFFAAARANAAPQDPLPTRVSLFGINALTPAYTQVLEALAARVEVHLFVLNPCREYWYDIVDEKGQARRRARGLRAGRADWQNGLLDLGNPLLASMGHAGQAFLDQLLELAAEHHDLFEQPGAARLLGALQEQVLELRDGRQDTPMTVPAADSSLQVQICHSPLREIQVLHDRLLHLFETLHRLEPRQVVVMAPDIDGYAPYIDAVFGAAEADRRIPWNVADRRLIAARPILEALRALLQLPLSRLSASEVLSLLEVPAVQRRFGVDAAGLERIRTWVRESGVRWGTDAAMRRELGLPAEDANTWDFGLRRLFLGYAMPTGEELYRGLAPYADLEGGEASALGFLQELVDRLSYWRGRLQREHTAAAWQDAINTLLDDFFAPGEEEEHLVLAVREAVDGLRERCDAASLDESLSREVVQAELEALLDQSSGGQRFLAGGVTFCNLVPMRSIPFRVVCLLGLNDKDFPRTQRPLSFDLVAQAPRRGDRSRRLDDRYLFLETLISAREVLYLSFVGHDIRDNSERVPSVLVSELLDYVGRAFRTEDASDLLEQITVRHPLQPFSRRYFEPSGGLLFSYAADWLAAARSDAEARATPFVRAPLAEPDAGLRRVDLDDLVRFLSNPARAFLQRRLRLRLIEDEEAIADLEPFSLAGLERYQLDQELLAASLEGSAPERTTDRLRARGVVPHGAMGELALNEQLVAVEGFLGHLQPLLDDAREPLELELALGDFLLEGQLRPLYGRGRVTYRFGSLKARDRLRLWVPHLVLCLLQPAGIALASTHLAEGQALHFAAVADPAALLHELLGLWWRGLCEPLPFFPETSLVWAGKRAFTATLENTWNGDYNRSPEAADPAVAAAFRGRDPLREADFQILADLVYGPLLAAAECGKLAP